MEIQTAIEILEYHQEWRLGKREDMIHEPKKLTEALDIVLSEVKKFRLGAVSGSLPSNEEIIDSADEWVFDINGMKWSNNDGTAGDNYGSFIAGAKFVLSRLSNDP